MKQNPYTLLGLATDAPPGEIRRAWEAIMTTFRKDEIAVYALVETDEERTEFLQQVENAYRLLSDTRQREQWDGDHEIEHRWEDQTLPPGNTAVAADDDPESQPLLDEGGVPVEMTASGEVIVDCYDGAGLQRVRVARGLSRAQIAETLKLSRTQVQAIEEMNQRRLPAPVYVKGFVRNYARYLRLDVEVVTRDYMEAFDRAQK